MAQKFHDRQRELQERFDTTRMADKIGSWTMETIGEREREFIESRDMFFLATVDSDGHPNCSYKGGEPGFVRVLDERTIAFPNYDGNGMYLSMGNVLQNGEVGMLFIDFEGQTRTRLNGTATVDFDDPLMAEYPGAQFIVRVRTRQVFENCPRYIHKMQLVERSQFVPKANEEPPVPSWKVMVKEHIGPETLPTGDPALREDARVADS